MSAVVFDPRGPQGLCHNFCGKGACLVLPGRRVAVPARARGIPPRAQHRERAVFDLRPDGQCTIYDVRDAVETCSGCSTTDSRRACFVVFGLDSDRVDKYHGVVETLTRCIQLKVPEDGDKKRGLSAWLTAAGRLQEFFH